MNTLSERLQELKLTPAESQRYARHITLPQVGLEGQLRLKAARVLCIGAGGLGSPVTMHLAAAGVGVLGLVDADTVEASNLHRQLLHGESDIGRRKVDSALETLREINPNIVVKTHAERFVAANARSLARGYDLIIDGTDNFPTRYLSNDVAYHLGIPNVYGSIFQFEGQVSVFAPCLGGPCYRCMFPQPPEPGMVPNCAEGGVFGVLPGIVGALQAAEAIKLILGMGEPLVGKLMHIDVASMKVRTFTLQRDPQCPLCGESPSLHDLVDYEAFCGVASSAAATESTISEVDAPSLKARLDAGEDLCLIDVREPFERQICAISRSLSIPLGELTNQIDELPRDRPLVLHCKSGTRSARGVEQLQEAGFTNVSHLAGGILAWIETVDPEMKRY